LCVALARLPHTKRMPPSTEMNVCRRYTLLCPPHGQYNQAAPPFYKFYLHAVIWYLHISSAHKISVNQRRLRSITGPCRSSHIKDNSAHRRCAPVEAAHSPSWLNELIIIIIINDVRYQLNFAKEMPRSVSTIRTVRCVKLFVRLIGISMLIYYYCYWCYLVFLQTN
jgi:hypothetical protein